MKDRTGTMLLCGERAFLAKGPVSAKAPGAGTKVPCSRLGRRLTWLGPRVQVEDEENAVRASIVLSPFIFLLSLKVVLFCGLLLLFMLVVTWVLPLTL